MWNCMSIRNHCCAQLVCLIEIYYELNWTYWCAQWGSILGTQWEVISSTGNYNVLNWTLLGCLTGSYVLNRKLQCAQLDIIGVLNGNYNVLN